MSRLVESSASPADSDLYRLRLTAEKVPNPSGIFRRRKIDTVFVRQLLLAHGKPKSQATRVCADSPMD